LKGAVFVMDVDNFETVWPEWKIIELIGEGAYGKVYKAVREDHGISAYSAIKAISIPQNDSEAESLRLEGLDETATKTYFEEIVKDFINEIKLMVSLKGTQNIVSVEDYKVIEKNGKIGWDIYIRMELLTSFNDFIGEKKLTEKDVIKLGLDICSALELCAQRGIIHRDIKPENIFISDFGYFKLGDFGIGRQLEKSVSARTRKGTLNYMAPEVNNGSHYDSRADIYSLGIVLYKLLNNNRIPFLDPYKQIVQYGDRVKAVEKRMDGEPLPPPVQASTELAAVILKACAFKPEDRFGNSALFKSALSGLNCPPADKVASRQDKKNSLKPDKLTRQEEVQKNGKADTNYNGNVKMEKQSKIKNRKNKRNSQILLTVSGLLMLVIVCVWLFYKPVIVFGKIESAAYKTEYKLQVKPDSNGKFPIKDIIKLKNLTSLTLAGCNLTDITQMDLTKLKHLTSLDLSKNNISDLSSLNKLTNLKSLNLSYNQIIDITDLKNLTQLTELNLSYNYFSDISALVKMKNLASLTLYNDQIVHLDTLEHLKNLKELHLSVTSIGNFDMLQSLSGLKKLVLHMCGINNISGIEYLKNLTYLDLSANMINNLDKLGNLKNLSYLDLSKNMIGDVRTLKNFKKITYFDLSDNKLTMKQIFDLQKYYATVRIKY